MNRDWLVVFAFYRQETQEDYFLLSVSSHNYSRFSNDKELHSAGINFIKSMNEKGNEGILMMFFGEECIPCSFLGNPELEEDHPYKAFVFNIDLEKFISERK